MAKIYEHDNPKPMIVPESSFVVVADGPANAHPKVSVMDQEEFSKRYQRAPEMAT